MAHTLEDFNTLALRDPLELQKIVFQTLDKSLGGEYVLPDPNSTAAFLTEAFSILTAESHNATKRELDSTYPVRARTSEDLNKHMSDFDYVSMYSSPASTSVVLTLDKQYLVSNAKIYNDYYSKVVIPAETVFTIGEYKFGIFYPIDVQINRLTGNITAIFNTTEDHPLHQLTQNIVPTDVQKYMQAELLHLKIPIHQFVQNTFEEDLPPGQGFYKTYQYTDKFYAARIFTIKVGKKIELAQSQSVEVYDPLNPTAILQVYTETKALKIRVPQIYFTNDLMGSQLIVELYTTKGELDVDISGVSPDAIFVNYNIDKSENAYSIILNSCPINSTSIGSVRISGGSNELSFEEKRRRVINNAFHTTALITPMDIEAYFMDHGFTVSKYKDNLTNLISFAHKLLQDSSEGIVPTMTNYIDIREGIEDSVSSIRRAVDSTLTVLPTCLFKYDRSTDTCVPVSDAQLSILNTLPKDKLVEEFNSNVYTRTPFHIRLIPDGRYPKVASYNLMNPTLDTLKFDKDNETVPGQMVALLGVVEHIEDGAGGYVVEFLVNKSEDIVDIPEDDLCIYLWTTSTDGIRIGRKLVYVGMYGNQFRYQVAIGTSYHINRDHQLVTTTLKDGVNAWNHTIDLVGDYGLTFMVKKEYYPTARTTSELYTAIPDDLKSTHHVLLTQSLQLTLGYSLEDTVYNNVNLTWSGKVYQRHEIDVPLTYSHDVYETDNLGVPVITINDDGTISMNKLHNIGDPIYNEIGELQYLHRIGDIVYDDYNQPILTQDRVQIYYINAFMINAIIYRSEHPVQKEFRKSIVDSLESYFTTVRNAQTQIDECSRLYFRPTRTMGTAKFGVGDGVEMTMSLDMSFNFKCHVPASIVNDTAAKKLMTESIIKIIEENIASSTTFSMTKITDLIRSSIDSLEAIDVLGINDVTSLQTIKILEEGVQPSIRQELYLTDNGTIAVRKAINVEYVAVA